MVKTSKKAFFYPITISKNLIRLSYDKVNKQILSSTKNNAIINLNSRENF